MGGKRDGAVVLYIYMCAYRVWLVYVHDTVHGVLYV